MYPPDELWFRLLAGLLVGLALGSFVTMLSYRAPRRMSIVNPPSHCTHCNTPLQPRDLVPILSWVLEGGKCRHCGKSVSVRYVFIELVTALCCVLAFVYYGFEIKLAVALIGIVSLITLATINFERWRE